MRSICVVLFILFCISTGSAQTTDLLTTYTPDQTLTPEQCADLIKSVWDVVKNASEEFSKELQSKNEFETSADFQARIQKQKDAFANTIFKFSSDKKLDTKIFAVWLKGELQKYDADAQTYTVTSPSQVLIPPTTDLVKMSCVSNPFVTIVEQNKKGYKFAHFLLTAKPDFIWHVDKATAQTAKSVEQKISFKVWFKFDLTQPITDNIAPFVIVPVKISLMNQDNSMVYWTETLTH